MQTILENEQSFICEIQAPCFQALSQEEVALIQKSRTQVHFRKGENLTKQGAFASYVLFVIKGLVRQFVEGDGERNFNLSIIQSGDFIGLSALFGNPIFNYSSIAITDTVVYLVEKEALLQIIKKNSTFSYDIIKHYNEQNNSLFEIIKCIQYKQMNGRLADALLYLSSDQFYGHEIFSNLSRKDLADFAGISTESTVKLLKQFEKEGLLKLDEKNIIISNKLVLLEISKRG
jgi:CRP-like cAMP-binding protein